MRDFHCEAVQTGLGLLRVAADPCSATTRGFADGLLTGRRYMDELLGLFSHCRPGSYTVCGLRSPP